MLVTEHFTFAHIPKAGGEFLQDVIRAHFPIVQAFEGNTSHTPVDEVLEEKRFQPVFALVRNPWSWYVSWYTFCKTLGNNQQFNDNYQPGPDSFKRTISNLLRPNHSNPDVNAFMRERNIGLLAMHCFHVLCMGVNIYDTSCGRMEHLAEDFAGFLDAREIACPDALLADLKGPATNTTEHQHYTSYYDDELHTLVADKERHIIEAFGYRFGEGSNKGPKYFRS